MERRAFLGGVSAATLSALSASLRKPAKPAPAADDYQTNEVKTNGNTTFLRRYGQGPGLLMVHGFPRTSLMWRYVAPQLAKNYTVICVDLRGYGRSGVPASTEDHYPYTKRAMANELVDVMGSLDSLDFRSLDMIEAVVSPIVSLSTTLKKSTGWQFSM